MSYLTVLVSIDLVLPKISYLTVLVSIDLVLPKISYLTVLVSRSRPAQDILPHCAGE